MDYMRTTESTEEVSSHPVKNTRWGVKTWLEHARATEKPNLLPQNDLWPYLFGIKSRRNPPQLMNDKSNGKSRFKCDALKKLRNLGKEASEICALANWDKSDFKALKTGCLF